MQSINVISLINENGLSNSFLIEKKDYFILIDCGFSVLELKKHLNGKKIKYVLITHSHFDHTFYLDEIYDEFTPQIFMSSDGKDLFQTEDGNVSNLFYPHKVYLSKEKITFLINENGVLNFDSLVVNYVKTRGHSPCSVCYYANEHIFTGDLIFKNAVGRFDFPRGNKVELINSIKNVSKLKDLCFVHSGHGEDSNFKDTIRKALMFTKVI